ncbi:MAG: HAD family hydrolase [Rhodocyclaceae bacterium]|nr:HAD family hydrolase [Rhodocyclaceae bacterium]
MYRLRTLDVWDTLLRRRCHPDLIKLIAARHLALCHHPVLAADWLDPWKLLRERCLIEGELARAAAAGGADDEYTLRQVLETLLERVTGLAQSERAQLATKLVEAEVAIEKANTFADPDCRQALAGYPAERSLFLSDFYMPAGLILELLQHHGIADLAPAGISSCDVGLNKRSGRLFRHVLELHGVAAADHVHVGDNRHSDHDMPRSLGIEAVHYEPVEAHRARRQRERLYPDRGTLLNHIDEEVTRDAEALAAQSGEPARSALLLGARCAPLFVGYAILIAERAVAEGLERLFFLTREGEFFIEVYRRVFPQARLAGCALPQTTVLEVSRLATFCASLQEISTGELMRLWNLYSTQSMAAFGKTLRLDGNRLEALCARHDIAYPDPVTYPWKDSRVQALFADVDFRQLLQAQIDADRDLLLGYLDQHGFDEGLSSAGIVDIGWRGTIQDNLALLRPRTRTCGFYLALARFLNPQPANAHKQAFGPNLNQAHEFAHFLDAVSPIEMLCNSPNGSTEGYRRGDDGTVTAMRNVDPDENRVHDDFVRHFQQGVLLAADHWGRYADSHAILSGELRGHACEIWDALISRSPQELSEAYAALSHNEIFGVGHFVDKRAVPSISTLIRGVVDRRSRYEVIQYIKQTQWEAGLWKRRDLGLIHRAMLMLALLGGRLYKGYLRWRRQRRQHADT